jgi:hypothetical protein
MSNGGGPPPGQGPPPGKGPGEIPGLTKAAQAKLKGAHAPLHPPSSKLTEREALLLGSFTAQTTPRVLTDREVTLLAVRLEAL